MRDTVHPHQRLLLVEDDPTLLMVLTECLEDEGYEIRGVSHLAAGVELLQGESVDLIISDLFSPVFSPAALDAFDIFKKAAPNTPVIVSTAHGEAGQIDPAPYGLAAIILKPFELNALLARIRKTLTREENPRDGSDALPV